MFQINVIYVNKSTEIVFSFNVLDDQQLSDDSNCLFVQLFVPIKAMESNVCELNFCNLQKQLFYLFKQIKASIL